MRRTRRYHSRACHLCRTRKVKCDEQRPSCQTCLEARRQCPGYAPTPATWSFCDQTHEVENKSYVEQSKSRLLAQGQVEHRHAHQFSPPDAAHSSATWVVRTQPSQPVTLLATCHFLSNFVLLPNNPRSRGYLEFVIPLLADGADPKPRFPHLHFQHAFSACAMALFHTRIQARQDCGSVAFSHYTKALSATAAALQDPESAKSDATLATILLLGHFENVMGERAGVAAWGSHIQGAIQLVKARGPGQLSTYTGRHLFNAVRAQMVMQIVIAASKPRMDIDWWDATVETNEYTAQAQQLHMHAAQLRLQVKHYMENASYCTSMTQIILDLIHKCQDLDQRFVAWAKSLPSYPFHWQTISWVDHCHHGDYGMAEVFPGRVDAYHDILITALWNMTRCSRLILWVAIVRMTAWMCSDIDYRTTPEYLTAKSICTGIISDIIASVPCMLGWNPKDDASTRKLHRRSLSGFACGDDQVAKGLGGYFVTWPLACILSQDYLTDAQRAWVHGRLEYISNELGVRYANTMTTIKLRVPSMLITQDGQRPKTCKDFDTVLSTKPPSSAPSPKQEIQRPISPGPTYHPKGLPKG